MGKIGLTSENPPRDSVEALADWVAQFAKDVTAQMNGRITFLDNIKCNILDVSFTAANTDKLIRHSLGRIPVAYWLLESNVAASLYTGSVDATTDTITLKSSAIAETKVMVI